MPETRAVKRPMRQPAQAVDRQSLARMLRTVVREAMPPAVAWQRVRQERAARVELRRLVGPAGQRPVARPEAWLVQRRRMMEGSTLLHRRTSEPAGLPELAERAQLAERVRPVGRARLVERSRVAGRV